MPVRQRASADIRQTVSAAHLQRNAAIIVTVVFFVILGVPILIVASTKGAKFGTTADVGAVAAVVCCSIL